MPAPYVGYPRKDVVNIGWNSIPAGGFVWEHLKKIGELSPVVPAEEPHMTTKSSTGNLIFFVEAPTEPPPEEAWVAFAYIVIKEAGAKGKLKLKLGSGTILATSEWGVTGWVEARFTGTLTPAQQSELQIDISSTAAKAADCRAAYVQAIPKEEEPPPPSPPVEGSVPRGKTGTPRYRGNLHSEFGPIDVVEEEKHYRRTLARLLFGATLIILIIVAAWGLFNSWGDAIVIKAVDTIGENL